MEEIISSHFVQTVIGLPMNCYPWHRTFLLCRVRIIADKKRNEYCFPKHIYLEKER